MVMRLGKDHVNFTFLKVRFWGGEGQGHGKSKIHTVDLQELFIFIILSNNSFAYNERWKLLYYKTQVLVTKNCYNQVITPKDAISYMYKNILKNLSTWHTFHSNLQSGVTYIVCSGGREVGRDLKVYIVKFHFCFSLHLVGC